MGNIGLLCTRARSVLPRPRANFPQYGPLARLVRGYYIPLIQSGEETSTEGRIHEYTSRYFE